MVKRYIFLWGVSMLIVATAVFVVDHWATGWQTPKTTPDNADYTPIQKRFINQTVLTDLDKHYIINFKSLRDSLTEIQKKYGQKTYIYFVYLNNAAWIGLNERDLFTAASTVKVPLAMAMFRAAETKKIDLNQKYTVEDNELNGNFGDFYKTAGGKEFTLRELIHIMLKYSDNTAMNALLDALGRIGIQDPLDEIYTAMGWEFNMLGQAPDYEKINLKTLSNMFLALYNSTFLNIEDSAEILDYLSESPFTDKIAAGVPKDITVAHKIGTASDKETFSDCGIVYASQRHYILCLGSNGSNEDNAKKFMKDISSAVYGFVINH